MGSEMCIRDRSMKLSPLDVNVARQPTAFADFSNPSGYGKSAYGSSFTPLSSTPPTYRSTPFVSADPWNRQDTVSANYYGSQTPSQYYDQSRRFGENRHDAFYGSNILPPLQSFAPSYYSPWNQTPAFGAHGYGCNCLACARPYNSYSMGHGYAAQTAVG